jgi:hypothetical protein
MRLRCPSAVSIDALRRRPLYASVARRAPDTEPWASGDGRDGVREALGGRDARVLCGGRARGSRTCAGTGLSLRQTAAKLDTLRYGTPMGRPWTAIQVGRLLDTGA